MASWWREGEGGKVSCPRCSGHRLYRHGKAKPRRVLHGWMRGKRVSRLHRDCSLGDAGDVRAVVIALLRGYP